MSQAISDCLLDGFTPNHPGLRSNTTEYSKSRKSDPVDSSSFLWRALTPNKDLLRDVEKTGQLNESTHHIYGEEL
ncbi:MAG: hypothetical protein K2Y01_08055 [Rhabdochlamydiaceae bacterium]|nr:hypothetical protein [Rhabdochlamydiaceae bacterium]